MSALALALALLIAPVSSRRRLESLRPIAPARRRIPSTLIPACAALGLAFVVPVTVMAATAIVGATVALRFRRRRRLQRRAAESVALQARREHGWVPTWPRACAAWRGYHPCRRTGNGWRCTGTSPRHMAWRSPR